MDERVPEHRDSHASSSHEPSLEPMRSVDLGKHSVYTHFPKDRNCEIYQRTKITRAPITRLSVKGVNLETIIDMHSWCKTWLPNGSSRIRTKQKLFRKPKGACKSSWSRIGSLKSCTLTIPLEFGKACEDLSWTHCTSTPHRSQTNWIAERAVRRSERKYVCGTVAIRSG